MNLGVSLGFYSGVEGPFVVSSFYAFFIEPESIKKQGGKHRVFLPMEATRYEMDYNHFL